jgi:hypothetical protein
LKSVITRTENSYFCENPKNKEDMHVGKWFYP